MNLQFIKYFIMLADVKNFTQAAEKIHVVQSTFSTGIKKLEQQLNCKLFYRDNRQVLMTEEGRQLLPMAKDMLRTWNNMKNTFSDDQCKPLKLGVVSEIDFNAIVPMMKAFRDQYPNIETQIIEKSREQLQLMLKKNSIDCYFQKYLPRDHADLDFKLIRKDKLVLAIPETHPFATKKKLSLQSVDKQHFIERTNCSLYDEVEARLLQRKIKPDVVFRAKGDDMAKALVASGLGISLVPNIELKYPNISYVPISDEHFERKIFMIWKKGRVSNTLSKLLKV